MTFSDPGRAAQQNILVAGDKGAGGQILDEGAVDAWSGGEVKLGQCFGAVTARVSQAAGQTLLGAPLQFIIQEQSQEFHWTELALHGLGGAQFQGLEHTRELQLAQFWLKGMGQHGFTSVGGVKNSSPGRAKVWG